MSHVLGGEKFSSVEAIKKRCRDIIAESPGNEVFERVPSRHEPFLFDLIARHPNKDKGWEGEIDHFVVVPGRHGISAIRKNGYQDAFSFLKCAAGKDFSKKSLFTAACRWAIRESIVSFRESQFSDCPAVPCAISGELVMEDECHVDHADPPFRDIVKAFMDLEPDWRNIELTDCFGKRFAELEDEERFRSFHDGIAKLQITTKSANLKKK